ncbi:MAG: hypothetical protein IPM23_03020 [Candidatus Melainabacteria bacterium]|nr:hypothetical protein [Candidatus Melainabacteria bacterium]
MMQVRRQTRNNFGLATWAKWLIGVLVALFILTIGGLGLGAIFLWNFSSQATNPENVKKLVDGLVVFEEPLGEDYKYTMGFDIAGFFTLASVEDETTKTTYSFIKMKAEKEKVTAEEMVEQIASRVPTGSGETSSMAVKDKGTMPVAGIEMPYLTGVLNSKGTDMPALLGCVMPSNEKVFLLMALNSDNDRPIDVEAAKAFFSQIKAFK